MKVGIAPLAVGVTVAGTRLLGLDLAADAFGCLYLVVTTLLMARSSGLTAPLRA